MLQLELFMLMIDTLATRLESDGYFFTSYHSLLPDQTRYLWWGGGWFLLLLLLN